MIQTQVIEGTWEEVQEQTERLARQHAGERVRLIVLPEAPVRLAQPGPSVADQLLPVETRIRILDELADRNRGLPVLPPEAFDRESLYDERW